MDERCDVDRTEVEGQRGFEEIGDTRLRVGRGVAEQVARGVRLCVEVDDERAQPSLALIAARLQTIVDLPTPPFWLNTTRRMVPPRSNVEKSSLAGQ